MTSERLRAYDLGSAADRDAARGVELARPAESQAQVSPGGPPYRLLWCRIAEGAPGDPPDERYYADEVRPGAAGQEGHVEWEPVPGGLEDIVVHNVAEAAAGTHLLAEGTVVRVEERLDRSSPPEMVYLTSVPMPVPARLARIVSYENGTYTVQPVRRESGGLVEDGPPISGVPNLGELWDDEQGYLTGPESFDRYVQIFPTPAGWTMLLHPPRMV
jgi:hypothetical protein